MTDSLVNPAYGTLYLIPTPLGNTPHNNSLPPQVLHIIRSLDVFMVEQMSSAVRFLDWVGQTVPTYEIDFFELNKYTKPPLMVTYLEPLKSGRNAGILSEAGAPGVADPGAELVNMAHSSGIPIQPLVGPSSILLALMASGFNGQHFAFNGYLPRNAQKRRAAISALEQSSKNNNRTEIFMETPHRNDELLQDIISTCQAGTKLCTTTNLTLPEEQVFSQPISWWRKHREIKLGKKPTMFLIYSK